MKTLVIGGTLFIGRRLVERLLERGHDVWVLHRKDSHSLDERVHNLTADRNDPEAMKAIFREHRFELIFDNVYDWERGTTAEQVAGPAEAAAGPQLERYVFMSSIAAYGSGLDRTEDGELAPPDHPETYVRNKANTERALLAMAETGFPVVTLRPPFIYGPGNPFYREAFFWDRLKDDRPVILPSGGDRLMHFVYIHDLVWSCTRVIDVAGVAGHAFNIGDTAPVTQAQLVHLLADVAGKTPRTVDIPREAIQAAGGEVMGPGNLYFGTYYDLPPITFSIEKARRMLHFEPTSFRDGLSETYEWYRKEYEGKPPDYSFEDRLLELTRGAATR